MNLPCRDRIFSKVYMRHETKGIRTLPRVLTIGRKFSGTRPDDLLKYRVEGTLSEQENVKQARTDYAVKTRPTKGCDFTAH